MQLDCRVSMLCYHHNNKCELNNRQAKDLGKSALKSTSPNKISVRAKQNKQAPPYNSDLSELYNNNNNQDNVCGTIIMTQSHCESAPGLSDECRLSTGWLLTPRPSHHGL